MFTLAASQDARSAVLLADIAVVLLSGLLLGRLARHVGQPAVVGEIAAGILLGPTLLGRLPGDLSQAVFPTDVKPLLSAVSQVGLVLFMFVVGWEFEKQMVRPYAGLAAQVSLLSVAIALGAGVGLAAVLHPHHSTVAGHHVPFAALALFLGTAVSVTALPVLARILTDRQMTSTRVGGLALACAAVSDVLAWYLLALVSGLAGAGGDYGSLIRIGTLSLCYLTLMLFAVRPLLARFIVRLAGPEHRSALLAVVCAGVFLSSWLTSVIGLHAIFGAFLFGFVTPREKSLGASVREPVEHVSRVLLPVFFIVTGLNVDIGALDMTDYAVLVLIIATACVGKLVGAIVPARISGLSWAEARDLGILMNTRGLTELIVLTTGASLGILDGQLFTMLVIMALATTAMTGPLLSGKQADPYPDLLSSSGQSPKAGTPQA